MADQTGPMSVGPDLETPEAMRKRAQSESEDASVPLTGGGRLASHAIAAHSTADTLQDILDAVPAMINVKDLESHYLFMNRYQADIYGIRPEDAIDRTATDILGARYGNYTHALDQKVIASGKPLPYVEEAFTDAQGTSRSLLTTKVPLQDPHGCITGVITLSVDITARKEALAALSEWDADRDEARMVLKSAIESMNDGFIMLDGDNRLVMCNQRYREFYPEVDDLLKPGAALDDIINSYAERVDLYPTEEEKRRFVHKRSAAWTQGRSMEEPTPSGRWIETRDQPAEGGYWIGIRIDATERKQAEQALANSEARYRTMFDAAPISLWEEDWSMVKARLDELRAADITEFAQRLAQSPDLLKDLAGRVRILDVNEATLRLYRVNDKHRFLDAFHARLRETPGESTRERILALAVGRWRLTLECDATRLDGTRFDTRMTVELPEEHREDWKRVFAAVEDITEAKALSQQLHYYATHDVLTGLVNRREFENRLQRALSTVGDQGAEHALCYLDLDQFKVVNDTCGHVAGDELLRRLGRILAQKVRSQDTLARLGGDEFGVLLEHCTLTQAERVANMLKNTIEDFRFVWEEQSFGLGVSIGLVPIRSEGQTLSDVLSAADAACYAAKEQGRNRIHVYHEDDEALAHRYGEMRWVARIQRAMEEDRFELASQPIIPVSGQGARTVYYECLLRLRDEQGQLAPPGAFLAAAERYNLSPRLDRMVVKMALRALAAEPAHLEQLHLCSINLSALSLADAEFLSFVTAELENWGVPAEKICFEITETAAITYLPAATRFMRGLRERGCRFALDDFGSGLSSFAYLKQLPVDFLKIDGVFVKDIVSDPIDRAMVRSINDIGHVMGKQTIAEFVESEDILRILREIGVDYAQGYATGKPQLLKRPR